MVRPATLIAISLLAVQVPLALTLPLRTDRYLGWAPFHETATFTLEQDGLTDALIRERYGLYHRLGPDGRDWETNRMRHVLDRIRWVEQRNPSGSPVHVRYRINGGPEQTWSYPDAP